jgi:type IV pilus assembly protein PilB
MMSAVTNPRLQGIPQLLVNSGFLDERLALEYQQTAQDNRHSFLQCLVDNPIVDTGPLASMLAHQFGLPLFDLNCLDKSAIPLHLVNEDYIKSNGILPLFHHNNQLFIAMGDPLKQSLLKEIQFHTGTPCCAVIVEIPPLLALINEHIHNKKIKGLSNAATHNEKSLPNSELFIHTGLTSAAKATPTSSHSIEDAPIVQFVQKIIVDAIHRKVSDIHFEPYEQRYRIRYRIDGVLSEVEAPALSLAHRIASRIKIMAKLDISERRMPQDGQFKIPISANHAVDVRVSTCPTIAGEKAVLRILDTNTVELHMDSLGLSVLQKNHFVAAIEKPQGLVLVTGPTGSGKTVTLYTALNQLNHLECNISTVEDPVEIKIPGINQVNINPKVGLTFATTLRAFLRQDPDILMVGEIRDVETAEIAIKAAHTGHLVLSTLHTNSAAETVTRLLNMGIQAFNLASSITLIIAQRLARKLCDYCKQPHNDLTNKQRTAQNLVATHLNSQTNTTPVYYKARGCRRCNQGYRGRVGLFEVMPITKSLNQLILAGASARQLQEHAQKEGMLTIYQSGLALIHAGITTFDEIHRVTLENN